jgi:hypothetical protein
MSKFMIILQLVIYVSAGTGQEKVKGIVYLDANNNDRYDPTEKGLGAMLVSNGREIISFKGNQYRIRFKAARRPADYQMNIYLPAGIEQAAADTTQLLVNVFAGSAKSVVEMRFGKDGRWQSLLPVVTIDPQVLRMHQLSPYLDQTVNEKVLEEVFGWKMDYPGKSRHMWQGKLPSRPAVGSHTVSVRTTDMFGQSYAAHKIIMIR